MEIGNGYVGYSSGSQSVLESKAAQTAQSSEAEQMNAAENKTLTGMDYLKNMEKKISGAAFFVGTVSYGQTYGNKSDVNFVVNPKFLGKLGTDMEATKRFEEDVEYLHNFAKWQRESLAASGWEVVSQGWFCDENGNWGGWCVTRKTNQKSFLETFSENTDKISKKKQEEKQEAKRKEEIAERKAMKEKVLEEIKDQAKIHFDKLYIYDEEELEEEAHEMNKRGVTNDSVNPYDIMQCASFSGKYKNQDDIYVTASAANKNTADNIVISSSERKQTVFDNTKDFLQYLSQNYDTVRRGMVKISGSYLRECLADDSKMQELFDNLKNADAMAKDAEENIKGYQGMKITIDKDGKMETETYGGSVTFNEAKRARQLAAAKMPENVRMVLGLLAKDLSDCENGLKNGMCDEDEVAKVRAMIAKANQRMREVSSLENTDKKEEVDTFSINLLL